MEDTNDEDGIHRLMDIYDLCVEASDNDGFDILPPLAPSDEQWLYDAITYYTMPSSPLRRIEKNISLLRGVLDRSSDDNMTYFINALKELQDITENLELARDFVKLDGLSLIEGLLEDDNNSVCCETSTLLGTVNQNNNFCQLQSVRKNIIEKLMHKIVQQSDSQLLKKLIFALSCTVRGNYQAFDRFKRTNGFDLMLNLINSSSSSAIRCKIAFFIFSIISENDLILFEREMERCMENFNQCILNLTSFMEPETEHLLGSLYRIFQTFPSINPSKRPELIDILENQKTLLSQQPEAEEINYYIDEILRMLSCRPNNPNIAPFSLALTY